MIDAERESKGMETNMTKNQLQSSLFESNPAISDTSVALLLLYAPRSLLRKGDSTVGELS